MKAPEIWGKTLRIKILIIVTPIEEGRKDISIKIHFKTIEKPNTNIMVILMKNIKNGGVNTLKIIIKHIIPNIHREKETKDLKIMKKPINNFIKTKKPIEKGSNNMQDRIRVKDSIWKNF